MTAAESIGTGGPLSNTYIVLDNDDRIRHVSPGLHDELGSWAGHVLWDHLPGARDVYGPCFSEARETGEPVERLVFYSGRVKRLTAVPARDGLAVHVECLATLNVRTLGTLAESLREIAAVLDAQEHAQLDSRVDGSLQALP